MKEYGFKRIGTKTRHCKGLAELPTRENETSILTGRHFGQSQRRVVLNRFLGKWWKFIMPTLLVISTCPKSLLLISICWTVLGCGGWGTLWTPCTNVTGLLYKFVILEQGGERDLRSWMQNERYMLNTYSAAVSHLTLSCVQFMHVKCDEALIWICDSRARSSQDGE